MKINGNAIRPGNVIEHKNRLWRAMKIQHTQPGKGGAYLQVELLERKLTGRGIDPGTDDADRVERAIHLTINGIAAGLRNTG